ncbi:hypothetical protein Tco_0520372, partial [Tanacetum coccineum]
MKEGHKFFLILVRNVYPFLSLYELPFHKEVPGLGALLSFSFENEKNVFNPEILTSKGVYTSLLPELYHRGTKAFKPGHLAARLGCAETKFTTWDDLAFKLIILGWNVKHRRLQNVDPWKRISDKRAKNEAKFDKTEHGMEKREKDKVKIKVYPDKVK